jgi:hypothetical protein
LKTTEGSPNGERNYWIVSEAEIDGPRIKARLAAPGSDWMRVSEDGFWRPDVRARAERYRWLNTSLFVAKGRLLGTGSIEYAVYRIR